MTPSTVPGIIAWPLIVFMTAVLIGRYRWCNHNLYEKYFNRTLTFLLVAQILREHLVQNILVGTAFMTSPGMWQLGSAALAYSFTEFIGFTLLWSGNSEVDTRRKHRYYRVASVFFAAGLFISGSRARLNSVSFELMHGWGSMVNLSCMTAMLLVLATQVIRNSLRELHRLSRRRERWVALNTLSMGIVGVGIVLHEFVLHTLDQLGWTNTAAYRQETHQFGLFFAISAPFVVAAVPLAMKLICSLGLDPISRSWCQLQPLRQAMRAVAPECIFGFADEPGRGKSALQLHHTVIEIRDAILRLRPYVRAIPAHDLSCFLGGPNAVPPRDHGSALAALRLVYAARAKAAGSTVDDHLDVDSAAIVASRAATLEEEAAELIRLAKWWPTACAATESAANTKASSAI
ncbi:hypothetical protein LAUMK191_01434 [Mycobacterium attenuatum]|uniref:DUF6545 domain-containing protein n=1 Tax=Mycobacterium attenuatum TaxID=2341086 RepID=UPI000F0D3728|nr:DUF6545 domain-containing protein [Mycobacterium attenuatum]VBA49095.1 hypothetical protein LAUMK191_01434 [Mycobacterium attenuatum]